MQVSVILFYSLVWSVLMNSRASVLENDAQNKTIHLQRAPNKVRIKTDE